MPKSLSEMPLEVQQALRHQPVRQRSEAPATAAPRPVAAPHRYRPRHRLFHSQRALRHGVVMMTVLGPCRALQPYDKET
jgi:hypothetical protein